MDKQQLHKTIRDLMTSAKLTAKELIENVREVRDEDLAAAKKLLDADQEKIDARRRELGLRIRGEKPAVEKTA